MKKERDKGTKKPIKWTNERRAVADLVPAEYNPRQMTKKQAADLRQSLERFGLADPVVLNTNGIIIGGHQRVTIMADLGIKECDVRIPNRRLTAKEERELNLRLNKNLGEWDLDKLLAMDESLLKDAGWDDKELDKLLNRPSGAEDDDFDIKGALSSKKAPTAKMGQVWALGRHRLMCGDSTKRDDVERLMDGKKAEMVFTDPPYALFGNSTGVSGVADDKMIRPFFRSVLSSSRANVVPFGHIYICCDWRSFPVWYYEAIEANVISKNCIIWNKGPGGLGNMYQLSHEFLFFASNAPIHDKVRGRTTGGRKITGKSNVWNINRTSSKKREHNAAKPVELCGEAISNSSDEKNVVLDLFGGSGSTLIACEQLNRSCFMMEIDPKYCDVIIARWEKLTDKKAKKL